MMPNFLQRVSQPFMQAETTRRQFLLGAVAVGTGFAVGYHLLGASDASAADGVDAKPERPFTAYLTIDTDGKVTVLSSQFEMEQGVYNGIATLVAEELGANWSTIEVVGVVAISSSTAICPSAARPKPPAGSPSMATSWDRYRTAGAAARMMLVAAAAAEWKVPPGEIRVENGVLSHASGNSDGFGRFAAMAATMPVPAAVTLKDPGDWTLIGNPDLKRFDSARKANGTERYP